jgi:hypothetical protein
MAVSEGWPAVQGRIDTKRGTAGRSRGSARLGSRSLKDALSAAGLGDAGPGEGPVERETSKSSSTNAFAETLMTPRISFFDEPVADRQEEPAQRRLPASAPHVASSVVSPPPWQRAATRGRRRALLVNTFAWAMTLMVAGTIIGVAGRYLAVAPNLPNMQAARQ